MSATPNENVLEEIKEIRRTIHAGFAVLIAEVMQANNPNNVPLGFVSDAFLKMQDVIGSLRSGDPA